jgi:hypothetical protein
LAKNTIEEKYEDIPPRADTMIESMRAVGYDLSMAVADLIDNSIAAKAQNIIINYKWDGPDSYIYILDDGCGMTEERLTEAMRFAGIPDEERSATDLGRFGLGLKTASFSQCRIFTVHTKNNAGKVATRCWNLDHVKNVKRWELCKETGRNTWEILSELNKNKHGTMVLWQDMDRVVGGQKADDEKSRDIFYRKFVAVKEYLEMIFHRYLSPPYNLSITLGAAKLKPWDPYLKSNSFTQELSNEKFENGYVKVTPYVLPHVSKRTENENRIGGGPKGWNLQQGFYLYRNKRMIISGGYFNLNLIPEDHCKLARIQVDINNKMDKEWSIDVRKANAIPPDAIRAEIEKVAKATRNEAVKIYRARSGIARKILGAKNHDVWARMKCGEKIVYHINRENPVVKKLVDELKASDSSIRKLFHVIESTIPHKLIILENREEEDVHNDLPIEINKPSSEFIEMCKFFYNKYRKEGNTHDEAVDIVLSIEPFDTHPAYRAALDSIKER